MALTRSGVAHNLIESPHILDIKYEDGEELVYVFSSEYIMNIFKKKQEDFRKEFNEKLSKRAGFTVKIDKICDIKLYSQTEKRGFLILGEQEFRCLEDITLDGHKVIMTS